MKDEVKDGLTENEEYFEHHKFRVDAGQSPLRIDKYLFSRLAHSSRNKIQLAAANACILVNGKVVKSNYKVKPLDAISIVFPHPPPDTEIKAEDIPLKILFEDEDIIVVNKEAGMVVHPAFANYTGTLVNALIFHFGQLPSKDAEYFRPGLVHRIDKDTSGILVVAKNESSMTHIARQFFDHSIERKYVALVWGDMSKEKGTIDMPLKRDPKDRRKISVARDEETAKHAITHYKVTERFAYVSLIECQLETGRTHQIRSHMKAIGHPIFNDETYGGADILAGPSFSKYKQFIDNCFKIMPRQALHAKSLAFVHPRTGKKVFFDSELPNDFNNLLVKWRKYTLPKE